MKKLVILLTGLSLVLAGCPMILENVFRVRGRALGDVTGEPISSVQVTVDGSCYSALTNVDGDFILGLGEGEWTLVFEKEGYESAAAAVTLGPDAPSEDLEEIRLVPVPDGDEWIVGEWVFMQEELSGQMVSWPGSWILELRADGTYTNWNQYDLAGEDQTGTWSFEDGHFYHDGADFGEVNKISDDEFELGYVFMRRGTEPWLFDQKPIEVVEGPQWTVWAEPLG